MPTTITRDPGDTTSIVVPEGVVNFSGVIQGAGGGGGLGYVSESTEYGGGGGGAGGAVEWSGVACTPGDVYTQDSIQSSNTFNVAAGGASFTAAEQSHFGNNIAGGGNTGFSGDGGVYGGYTAAFGFGYNGGSGNNGTSAGGGAGGNSPSTSLGGGSGGSGSSGAGLAADGNNYGGGGGGGFSDGTYVNGGAGGPGRLSITWDNPVYLNDPSSLAAFDITDTTASIEWVDNSETEDNYQIEVVESISSFMDSPTVSTDPNVTSVGIESLSPNTEYKFQVRAVSTMYSISSNWVYGGTFTTDETPSENTYTGFFARR